jgi:hypothetical protein
MLEQMKDSLTYSIVSFQSVKSFKQKCYSLSSESERKEVHGVYWTLVGW